VRQLYSKIFPIPFAVCFSIFFLLGCEKKFDTVINSPESVPFLSNAHFSLRTVYSDTMYNDQGLKNPNDLLTMRGVVSTKVVHADGKDKIESVHFNLSENLASSLVKEGILFDNGIFPDQYAGDSLYTQAVEFQLGRVFVGKFTLSVWSIDKSGNQSNVIYLPLEILRRDNQKPILSNLQMDSIAHIASTTDTLQLFIKINATDPDGQSDVASVYFNSFRPPSGLPASGNPYLLYDNGDPIHGDAVAGDGIYSQIIILPPSTVTGTYRFEFHALDRSFDSSNVIIKNILVTN
jgi:hypothetical protein